MAEIELFKNTFIKYKSDKSGYHSYENAYGDLFEDRKSVKNILEVGIHLGSSLRAWKELFPYANIIGLENNIERFFTEERIHSMYVDQSRPSTFDDFKSVMRGTEFDFIIDDGCHYKNETILTFWELLPKLKMGGYFIVEDIPEEYLSEWKLICEQLDKDKAFVCEIINMNNIAKTDKKDNIVFKVKRLAK